MMGLELLAILECDPEFVAPEEPDLTLADEATDATCFGCALSICIDFPGSKNWVRQSFWECKNPFNMFFMINSSF